MAFKKAPAPQPLAVQPEQGETNILDEVTQVTHLNSSSQPTLLHGTYQGSITSIDDNELWVTSAYNRQPTKALCAIAVNDDDSGRLCFLSFLEGNPKKPIVTGFLHTPNQIDKSLTLRASEYVQIQCGDSAVNITEQRVNIKARTIDTHSKTTNRLRGGSVKLN